jgi:hypothetical protein
VKKWTGTDNDFSIATTNAVTMLMDRTVSVEYEFGYQIRTQIEGQGSITTGINRNYFTPGETATLQAVPTAGWMFDHWEGNITGSTNPVSLTVNSDMSVKAVFIQKSTLSILTIGQGTITRSSEAPYPVNTRVTLTATPASGWSFRKWSGDYESISRTISITLSTSKTLQAEFVSMEGTGSGGSSNHSLSIIVVGKGSVSPYGGSFDSGTTITLTATPEDGWEFAYWTGDLSKIIKTSTLDVSMDDDKCLTAVFEEITEDDDDSSSTTDEDDSTEDVENDSSTSDTSTDELATDETNNSSTTDVLSSCSIPAMILILTVLCSFMVLGLESRK